MLGKLSTILTAKGLAAVGIAAASLGGGGVLLASSQTPVPPPPGIQQNTLDSGSTSSGSASGTLPSMPSPKGSHGAAVVAAVASCRSAVASAVASASAAGATAFPHGIGSCVSAVARKQGLAEKSMHAGSDPGSQTGTHPNPHSTGH